MDKFVVAVGGVVEAVAGVATEPGGGVITLRAFQGHNVATGDVPVVTVVVGARFKFVGDGVVPEADAEQRA